MLLLDSEIHLWRAYDRDMTAPSRLNALASCLSEEERAKGRRFAFPHLQHQYLITRALQRQVLSRYEPSIGPDQWGFDQTDYGKPFITNPLRQALFFNVSHTDGLVVIAVSRQSVLGVDVEYGQRVLDDLPLMRRCFTDAEWQWLMSLSPNAQVQLFWKLWTLKEAVIKAEGKGVSMDLQSFGFEFFHRATDTDDCGDMVARFEAEGSEKDWSFSHYHLSSGHHLALAVSGLPLASMSVMWKDDFCENSLATSIELSGQGSYQSSTIVEE